MSDAVGRAVLAILRRMTKLEAAAAKRQVAVLAATRKDLLAVISQSDTGRFNQFSQGSVLQAVDLELARRRGEALNAAQADAKAAAELGALHADSALERLEEAGRGLVAVSPELLAAVVDVTTDQVRAVWTELGTTLKATVRRAALGIVDPYAAMVAVQKVIRNPKTFGSSIVRAEAIVRTEVNRTFSLATDDRLRQSNERLGGGLRKFWLSASDARSRPSHVEAGESYGPGGDPGPIPIAEAYRVGAVKMMFPLDPRAPAEEVVNCRCRSVPFVEHLTESLLEAWRGEVGLCGCRRAA